MERYTMMIMHGERAYLCHSDFNGQMMSEPLHCISDEFNFCLRTSHTFQENLEDWGKVFEEEVLSLPYVKRNSPQEFMHEACGLW